MKRFIALLLTMAFCLGLCACGAPADNTPETTVSAAKKALDGKKVLIIGNSHTYVGRVVVHVSNSQPALTARQNDMGLFYLICQRNGIDVNVTNWCFSSHGLRSIFGESCTTEGACFGKNHVEYLTDRFYDYVVIQPGVGDKSEQNLVEDIANIVDFFRKENPDVKFALLGNASVYGNNATNKPYPGITSYYKTLAEQDFIMADWGKLVNDLIHQEVVPEGSTIPYEKNSFIIKDGFHPNMLSGYIASMMLFCAITGESAAEQAADLFADTVMTIMVEDQVESSYIRGDMDTNMKTVLTTPSELARIHPLIDQYLADKPYLNN